MALDEHVRLCDQCFQMSDGGYQAQCSAKVHRAIWKFFEFHFHMQERLVPIAPLDFHLLAPLDFPLVEEQPPVDDDYACAY